METKHKILASIKDLVSNLVYYDRKNDEDLSVEQLNEAVENGEISINEMVAEFKSSLENVYKDTTLKGDEKHRAVLSIINGCCARNCEHYLPGKCNHEKITVDKNGQASCPLLEGSININDFQG